MQTHTCKHITLSHTIQELHSGVASWSQGPWAGCPLYQSLATWKKKHTNKQQHKHYTTLTNMPDGLGLDFVWQFFNGHISKYVIEDTLE